MERNEEQYESPALVDTEALATARRAGCGVCITGGGAVAEEAVEGALETRVEQTGRPSGEGTPSP